MDLNTTVKLINDFEECPKCGKTIFMDELNISENEMTIKCKDCNWSIEVKVKDN